MTITIEMINNNVLKGISSGAISADAFNEMPPTQKKDVIYSSEVVGDYGLWDAMSLACHFGRADLFRDMFCWKQDEDEKFDEDIRQDLADTVIRRCAEHITPGFINIIAQNSNFFKVSNSFETSFIDLLEAGNINACLTILSLPAPQRVVEGDIADIGSFVHRILEKGEFLLFTSLFEQGFMEPTPQKAGRIFKNAIIAESAEAADFLAESSIDMDLPTITQLDVYIMARIKAGASFVFIIYALESCASTNHLAIIEHILNLAPCQELLLSRDGAAEQSLDTAISNASGNGHHNLKDRLTDVRQYVNLKRTVFEENYDAMYKIAKDMFPDGVDAELAYSSKFPFPQIRELLPRIICAARRVDSRNAAVQALRGAVRGTVCNSDNHPTLRCHNYHGGIGGIRGIRGARGAHGAIRDTAPMIAAFLDITDEAFNLKRPSEVDLIRQRVHDSRVFLTSSYYVHRFESRRIREEEEHVSGYGPYAIVKYKP